MTNRKTDQATPVVYALWGGRLVPRDTIPDTEAVDSLPEPVTEPVVKVTEPVVKVTEPVVKVTEPVVKVTEPVVKATEPVVKKVAPNTKTKVLPGADPFKVK